MIVRRPLSLGKIRSISKNQISNLKFEISIFNWPGLGPDGPADGKARRGPSPGQLKIEILKLGLESSLTVRKRSETSVNGPIRKRSKNGPKPSETLQKRCETVRNRPKPSEKRLKPSETVRNRPKTIRK